MCVFAHLASLSIFPATGFVRLPAYMHVCVCVYTHASRAAIHTQRPPRHTHASDMPQTRRQRRRRRADTPIWMSRTSLVRENTQRRLLCLHKSLELKRGASTLGPVCPAHGFSIAKHQQTHQRFAGSAHFTRANNAAEMRERFRCADCVGRCAELVCANGLTCHG